MHGQGVCDGRAGLQCGTTCDLYGHQSSSVHWSHLQTCVCSQMHDTVLSMCLPSMDLIQLCFYSFFLKLNPLFCENKINILQRLLAAGVQQTSIAFWCREALDTVKITVAKFKVTSKLLNSDNCCNSINCE